MDDLARDDQGIAVGGWAFDRARNRPVDRIVAFDGRRMLAQETPGVPRPDIAKNLGKSAAKAGFALRANALRGELSRIRVFAVSDGKASELKHYSG
ncbi:MAG TPA: hypothetical protein VEQ61_07285 [Thermoleophilaceae bacterium]|nr:hypothetical protein [Thermoleophilaceae bacterium]